MNELLVLGVRNFPELPHRDPGVPEIQLVTRMLAQPRQQRRGGRGGGRAGGHGGGRGAAPGEGAIIDPIIVDLEGDPEEDPEAALLPVDGADDAADPGDPEAPPPPPPSPEVPPPLDAEPPPDGIDVAEMDQLAREAELPRWDPHTGQFHHPVDNRILGRARPLDVGARNERVATYCRLHQCYPPIRAVRIALPMEAVARWFADGLSLPRGAAGRARHMAMYRELEAAHRGAQGA